MDIRNWPMDRIMQLPDHCFGRRWPIACERAGISGRFYDISEVALPERTVIWSVVLDWWNTSMDTCAFCRLGVGDQLPVDVAGMNACEPLLRGVGVQGIEPRHYSLSPGLLSIRWPMRMGLAAGGRRFVLGIAPVGSNYLFARVVLEVSSVPNEVPDCLLSGNLRSP